MFRSCKPQAELTEILSQAGGVQLSPQAAQHLLNLTANWVFQRELVEDEEDRFARQDKAYRELVKMRARLRQAGAPGEVHHPMLALLDLYGGRERKAKRRPPQPVSRWQLGVLIRQVEEVWREAGGKGAGIRWDRKKGGPVADLIEELLKEVGVTDRPSERTLFDAYAELHGRRPRKRKS